MAHPLLFLWSMKTKLTTKLLASISTDISSGRALWGILRANEYLSVDHPLRNALVTKAKTVLGSELGELEAQILGGALMSELSAKEQAEVRGIRGTNSRKQFVRALTVRSQSYAERRRTVRALRAA